MSSSNREILLDIADSLRFQNQLLFLRLALALKAEDGEPTLPIEPYLEKVQQMMTVSAIFFEKKLRVN